MRLASRPRVLYRKVFSGVARVGLVSAAQGMLAVLVPPLCVACGMPLGGDYRWLCRRCRIGLWAGVRLRSRHLNLGGGRSMLVRYVLDYDPAVSRVVTAMKYGDKPGLGKPLAALMRPSLDADLQPETVIVPVPMHPARLRERTYNQSKILARELAEVTGRPLRCDILIRKRNTSAQTGLDKSRRRRNVADAFGIRNTGQPPPAGVLLVDDVLTTGSTLRECARALLDSGSERVSACVLAQAVQ